MDKKTIKFDDTEIKEYKFHQNKIPISTNDVEINKIVVSNMLTFGKQDFKYFIGYKHSEKIKPLCILHSQMIIYRRDLDENRLMYFLIKVKKVFIKYVEIFEKVHIIKNRFNSEFIYSTKNLKAKKKEKEKKKKQKRRLSIFICINNIDRKDENYYHKVFVEEYYFIGDIGFFCSNSGE